MTTTNMGLTENGFVTKRLIDIQEDLAEALSSAFGEVDTAADSVFGQVIGVLSKPLADLWEQLENVYFSQYPDTADTVSLDYTVALTGITREPATYSQGIIGLKGNDGTVVPALTQIAQDTTNILFQTKADTTVTLTDVLKAIIKVDAVVEGQTYSLTVNGKIASYVAILHDTPKLIAEGLVAYINNIAHDISSVVTALMTDSAAFTLTAKSSVVTVVVTSANLSWWTPANIIALDKGAISAPTGTLIKIVNAVSGLDEAYNFDDIDEDSGIGRNVESDDALRLRRLASLKVAGAGSVEAIRAKILADVAEVSACIVLENATDIYDAINLMDAHSIKIIVAGGASLDIGKMIWQVKAGGIKVMGGAGAITVTFLDSQVNMQTIYFFRPTTKYAYVDVVVNESDPLRIPLDFAAQIQEKILEWGQQFTIGQEIIYQQLFGIIYQVPGILKVTTKIALMDDDSTPPGSGDWKTDNIEMPDATSYPEFTLSRITVA